jgi:hypothetical protein
MAQGQDQVPESLQAATKIAVEDTRAQWTTHNNLNQWFDDVKKDLLTTGLVENEVVFGNEGEMVSEVRFKMHSERRIINMDETHHDFPLLVTRAVQELSLTTILYINSVQLEE